MGRSEEDRQADGGDCDRAMWRSLPHCNADVRPAKMRLSTVRNAATRETIQSVSQDRDPGPDV